MADSTKTLLILENNVELQFDRSVRILDLLNANGISINQSCGGNGTCTTCRFFIRKGESSFSARTDLEQERADERGFESYERLSCQAEIFNSAEIEIPKENF